MATLDTNEGYSAASKKVDQIKVVKKSKADTDTLLSNAASSVKDKPKKDKVKQLNDLKNGTTLKNDVNKEIKEQKNQLEQLFNLFKSTLPQGDSVNVVKNVFLESAQQLKSQIQEILVEEIVSTLGCSEEQSYEEKVNQPIYIKVNQIDLLKILKYSPTEKKSKFYYEESDTTVGVTPYSLDRELYKRLQNLNIPFSDENSSSYVGVSGSELFDIEYVQYYPNVLPTNFGDFFKVTLKPQLNNRTAITDFLKDYYGSLDVLNFDTLVAQLMNSITGSLDYSLSKSKDELTDDLWFVKVLKRIMGLCTDPNTKIDVSGTAKLSDEDFIDDSFFEIQPGDLRIIDQDVENIVNGVMEFESCGEVKLPMNVEAVQKILEDVIAEKTGTGKINALNNGIDSLVNDPKWKGLGIDGLNLKLDINSNIPLSLPKIIVKTILTPKVILGFLIMVKGTNSELSETLDSKYDDLQGFMKTFKKFVLNFMQKVTAKFVEILFNMLKKNIKILVESILIEIVDESKNKQLSMYASIVYALLALGEAFIDFRNCKSVVDEILKLLNLGLKQLNTGLPLFALAGASLLGGVSATRSFANTIGNLQKLGIPTGDAPDGSPNMMNMAIKSMTEGNLQEMFENGKVEVFVPPLTVTPGFVTTPAKGTGKFM